MTPDKKANSAVLTLVVAAVTAGAAMGIAAKNAVVGIAAALAVCSICAFFTYLAWAVVNDLSEAIRTLQPGNDSDKVSS